MKVLTVNFLTCAVKTCKTSPEAFPLHFRDAELAQQDLEFNPEFIKNMLLRLDWNAFRVTTSELGFSTIPAEKPEGDALNDETLLRDLHKVLLETQVMEGKLVCGHCAHEYAIKEGIANFLLPNHLV
ncbi:Trm112p-domain-containing protein [Xylona heveae TC161]|uniref:Multifunctional methyltransferase subunit trm112 n=1 Tax=Xylona heveae (strain CBS 132557 / TC161) TaxID=1328760 RepID=A0A165IB94_XYLHT|nr:Trm112p-domain-containing protein [Xylona heveae TC161]KZF24655.1 Trm112p-domain-containing protein [Xylona heveae TC161]